MAHFAQLNENNIVTRVIVVNNDELLVDGIESEGKGIEFCQSLFGGRWIQTSYNNNFRNKYAWINSFYHEVYDVFISPKPFESWILDEETYEWESPVPYPVIEEGSDESYVWDENTTSWLLLPPSN